MVPEPARSDLTGLSSFSFLALAVVHEPSANETATAVPKQRAAASPAIDGSYPRLAGPPDPRPAPRAAANSPAYIPMTDSPAQPGVARPLIAATPRSLARHLATRHAPDKALPRVSPPTVISTRLSP